MTSSEMKNEAKLSGFFASPILGETAVRIAVVNVTGWKRVAAFAENKGLSVTDKPSRYPALVKVSLKEAL